MSVPQPAPSSVLPASGYAELSAEIRGMGLLTRRPRFYAAYFATNLLLGAAVVTAMVWWSHSWLLVLLAPALAVISTQFGFFGHDVGHFQVTRGRRLARVLGLVSGNLLGGLSFGWWIAKHNAHHAHPNDLETDPDVKAGAIVFDASQVAGRRGLPGWLTRHQAALFFPMLLGEAINLHVSSIQELFRPGLRDRAAEAVLIAVHLVAYGTLLVTTLSWPQALVFFGLHKGLQGVYLGCSFAPGHKGMPVMDEEQARDPLLRQVLTSRNIRGSLFMDTLLGGLNYQIEHHLFPSMPRPSLRLAQPVVQRFCAARGVPYLETSAVASYAAVLRHLHSVGVELRTRPTV